MKSRLNVIRVDENGFRLGHTIYPMDRVQDEDGQIVYEYPNLPSEYVDLDIHPTPDNLVNPKWDFDNQVWVEGATIEEIEALNNAKQVALEKSSLEEQVKNLQETINFLLTKV